MILDSSTRKIQVLADATATTTESPVVADYCDFPGAQPISNNSITNGTTAVDIVAAPTTGQRRVTELSIYNADTANRTFTVRYNDNGTTRIIVKVLLNPGQSLVYTSGSNSWQVVTATQQGGNKASFSAHKNATDQTGVLPGTDTKVTATTELYDVGSYYDAANSKWTPPAGKVIVGGHAYITVNVVDQNPTVGIIYKNGARFKIAVITSSGTQAQGALVVAEDDANGTDFYELYVLVGGAGNKTIDGTSPLTYFWGSSV